MLNPRRRPCPPVCRGSSGPRPITRVCIPYPKGSRSSPRNQVNPPLRRSRNVLQTVIVSGLGRELDSGSREPRLTTPSVFRSTNADSDIFKLWGVPGPRPTREESRWPANGGHRVWYIGACIREGSGMFRRTAARCRRASWDDSAGAAQTMTRRTYHPALSPGLAVIVPSQSTHPS
jgi:hypothetical protein